MNWKKWAADYLGHSRRDRVGVLILLFLILGVYFLPQLIPGPDFSPSTPDSTLIQSIARLGTREKPNSARNYENEEYKNAAYPNDRNENLGKKNRGELFEFDPNTVTPSDWKRLGLREKTIGTILNYRAKGGKFRKPEDLKKIYGLFPDEYERLERYIKIEDRTGERGSLEESEVWKNTRVMELKSNSHEMDNPKNRIEFRTVDINRGDTSAFIALPGVGSKLASRIINFRQKLGGFYSIEQVGETFGLADSTFQKIKQFLILGSSPIKKMNLNSVTLDELKSHPYIRYPIAGPVIAYRTEHGPFRKIEDLKKVMAVTDEVYRRVEKYLSID